MSKKENWTIRPFEKADAEKLLELYAELGYPTTLDKLAKRLSIVLKQEDYHLLLACYGEEIVGLVGYAKMYFFEQDGIYFRILALVVRQDHRRKGIASQLLQAVKEAAQKEGGHALALNSGIHEERTCAHQFYQSLGFEKKSYGFAMRIDEITK